MGPLTPLTTVQAAIVADTMIPEASEEGMAEGVVDIESHRDTGLATATGDWVWSEDAMV